MLRTAGIVCASNGLGFALTAALETHKLTDLVGVGSFVLAAADLFLKAKRRGDLRAMLLDSSVMVWGVRLAGFLFARVIRLGHDARLSSFFREPGEPFLDKTRSFFPVKLAGFWAIQALWPMLCLIPLTLLHASPVAPSSALSNACTGLAAAAIGIEAIADWQKYSYRNNPANAKHWCDKGLWALARYPNYFAETLFWAAVWAASAGGLSITNSVISLFSPCFVYFLLNHVSGAYRKHLNSCELHS